MLQVALDQKQGCRYWLVGSLMSDEETAPREDKRQNKKIEKNGKEETKVAKPRRIKG